MPNRFNPVPPVDEHMRTERDEIARDVVRAAIEAGLASGAGLAAAEVFNRLETKYRERAGK